ncbi:MAG: dephospho-CoA kinase [Candidatus Neomarinimicrobiota bacterium]|jgi:dephospho-CoA kinase|nr:dephospho-CoA kinase [Candidatus Neomarinimicrobiota bacterium]
MNIIGITGAIGSGKSTAANFLKKKVNAYYFDADLEAKNHLMSSAKTQEKIIAAFGRKKIMKNDSFNLQLLASVAFKNKINQKLLNQIIWPEVYLLIKSTIIYAKKNNFKNFIVDAALLIEANFNHLFNYIILITAPEKIRIERALKRNNLSLNQIKKRNMLQWPDQIKQKYANYVIENDKSISDLQKKLTKIF